MINRLIIRQFSQIQLLQQTAKDLPWDFNAVPQRKDV